MTRDLIFACPRCYQHIKCEDERIGQTIACPACGESIVVPAIPDTQHLRISSGRVPMPAHAHGAPLDAAVEAVQKPAAHGKYSQLAVASLVLSIGSLVLGPFGCIPGIIFGHLAKAELRRYPRLQGRELALAGTWVGYGFLVVFLGIGIWLVRRYVAAH